MKKCILISFFNTSHGLNYKNEGDFSYTYYQGVMGGFELEIIGLQVKTLFLLN